MLANPFGDVNRDGFLSPIDALLVINELNRSASHSLRAVAQSERRMAFDVNGDRHVSPIDALLVINRLKAEGEGSMLSQIRLEVTDTNNIPIPTIEAGQPFRLQGFVTDLTERSVSGVFAAYLDVIYDSALASVAGPITYGENYLNGQSGDTDTPGLIDEVGAFDGIEPLGPDERRLFSIPLTAVAPGMATFDADPADDLPRHDVLLYGRLGEGGDPIVPSENIMYVDAALTISESTAPVAENDVYDTLEDTPLTGTSVLANESDFNQSPLTAALRIPPLNGMIALNVDGTFTYTPNPDFHGVDSFTYVANNGRSDSNEATATINVAPVNDAPVARPDSYRTIQENALAVDVSRGVLENDSDIEGDPITAIIVSQPANGSLTFNPNGSFAYIPNRAFVGTDTFTYVVSDGIAESQATTVTIDVEGTDAAAKIILRTVDGSGMPIDTIQQGAEFTLQVLVQDVSGQTRNGVFAAYMDILFNNTLVTAEGSIDYGPLYPNRRDGTIVPAAGLVDDVGAFDGVEPLGEGETLLLSIPFTASQVGTAEFRSDPADDLPLHEILLFGRDEIVPMSQIEYGSVSLVIEAVNSAVFGFKFHDLDGDGSDDNGTDPPRDQVRIVLSGDIDGDGQDDTIETLTGPNGEYAFRRLSPGQYTVTEILPEGTLATTPAMVILTIGRGEVYVARTGQAGPLEEGQTEVVEPALAFGNFELIEISGRKFNDRDADGTQGIGEPGLAGWEIELTIEQPDGQVVTSSQLTDAEGRYRFEDVGPGRATIRERLDLRPGWTRTLPPEPGTYSFENVSGEDRAGLDFGNYLAIFTGIIAGSGNLVGSDGNDLVVVNEYQDPRNFHSSLAILPNLGGGLFGPPQSIRLPNRSRPQSVFVEDLNGDGLDDLAVALIGDPTRPSVESHGVLLFTNQGNGQFSDDPQTVLACGRFIDAGTFERCDGPMHIDGAPLTADGTVDILVTANFRSDTISIVQRDVVGGFAAPARTQHIPVGRSPVAVRTGMINADAHADIAVANYGSNSVSILFGDGSGNFTFGPTLDGLQGPTDIRLDDMDGDSAAEVIVTNRSAGEITFFLNAGNGTFPERTQVATGLGPQSLAVGDLNGDGLRDVAVANSEGGTISVLLADGQGGFARPIDFGLPPIPGINRALRPSPQVVLIDDLDGSGRLDLIVAHFLGGVSIHLNGVEAPRPIPAARAANSNVNP
jgi:hypothetical protein